MFAVLAFISLRVFTRVIDGRDRDAEGRLRLGKVRRDRVYRRSGYVMLAAIGTIGARMAYERLTGTDLLFWDAWNLTLVAEAFALYAFGYSWLVKGRFLKQFFTDETPVDNTAAT